MKSSTLVAPLLFLVLLLLFNRHVNHYTISLMSMRSQDPTGIFCEWTGKWIDQRETIAPLKPAFETQRSESSTCHLSYLKAPRALGLCYATNLRQRKVLKFLGTGVPIYTILYRWPEGSTCSEGLCYAPNLRQRNVLKFLGTGVPIYTILYRCPCPLRSNCGAPRQKGTKRQKQHSP